MTLLAKALGLATAERDRLLAAAQDQAPAAEQRAAPGEAADRPVPRLLPYAVADFTGRAAELDRLLELAGGVSPQPGSAVVISAIDGMAGVGKTALAVKAGHALADRFPDGQIFLDLHGFTPGQRPLDPGAALARLLRAVGVDEARVPERLDDRTNLWLSEVAQRRLLIVLDNALDTEQVRPLIPGHPGSLVLITSRRRLPTLDGAVSLSLDVLAHGEAVALFTEIVGAQRVAEHPEAVSEIVDLCGRLPLAVRISAARLAHRSTWTPDHLLARLRDQHQRLAELSAEAPGEDHGVAAAFAVSYDALDPDQQRAFRLAGLHPGEDFCARAVGALSGIASVRAEELLEDLLDHHLLIEHAPGRYTFHDLLRQHALRTAEAAEPEEVRQAAVGALLDHYRYTALTAMTTVYPHDLNRLPRLGAPGGERVEVGEEACALSWLLAERANLVACAQCPAAREVPGYARDLSSILYRYLDIRGFYSDALALHAAALHTTRAEQDRAGQVQALIGLGSAYWRLGQFPRVLDHYLEALALARELDDLGSVARCLSNLGMTYLQTGHYAEAVDFCQQALHLSEQVGDRLARSHGLTNIALAYDRLGRYEEALDYHRQTLESGRETGVRVVEARALLNLGMTESRLGRFGEALDHLEQARLLAEEIGDPNTEAITLTNLGAVHQRLGQYPEALEYCGRALDIFRAHDDRAWEARATHLLSRVHTDLGRYQEAGERQAWALATARELGDTSLEADALNALGENTRAGGAPAEALDLHGQALALGTEQTDLLVQARAQAGLGDACHDLQQLAQAATHWRRAHALYRQLGVPEAESFPPKLAALGEPVAG